MWPMSGFILHGDTVAASRSPATPTGPGLSLIFHKGFRVFSIGPTLRADPGIGRFFLPCNMDPRDREDEPVGAVPPFCYILPASTSPAGSMPIASLLNRERVSTSDRALDRQDALAAVADLLGQSGALEALLQREQMGSTAIGHGVAVPHGRMPGLKAPVGAFLRLATPAQFGDQEVDLVFALLMPTDNPQLHLQALADIATLFSGDDLRERLRGASDDDALFRLLTGDAAP